MKKQIITMGIVAAIIIAISVYIVSPQKAEAPIVSDFDSCAAVYPVMTSYPEQCATPDGRHFVRDIGNELEKLDLIQSSFPRPGSVVTSPLTAIGQARGTWFFEASFPVVLMDEYGVILAETYAQAQTDWMTEDMVPYESSIQFTPTTAEKGSLILKKDNPSGLPEYDDQLIIPVKFK